MQQLSFFAQDRVLSYIMQVVLYALAQRFHLYASLRMQFDKVSVGHRLCHYRCGLLGMDQ